MSQNTDIKDKVIIDPSKIKGLQDILSRAEPGDKFDFSGTCSLDESGEKTATFSIVNMKVKTKVDVELNSDGADDDEAGEDQPPADDSAAAQLFRDQNGNVDEEEPEEK